MTMNILSFFGEKNHIRHFPQNKNQKEGSRIPNSLNKYPNIPKLFQQTEHYDIHLELLKTQSLDVNTQLSLYKRLEIMYLDFNKHR
jgi:hypothetical protein